MSTATGKQSEGAAITKSDLCITQPSEPGPSKPRPPSNRRCKSSYKREHRNSKSRRVGSRGDESYRDGPRSSKTEDSHNQEQDGPFPKVSRRYNDYSNRRGSSNRDFFKEWLYLDGHEAAGEPYQSKFARQLSSDSRDNSEPNVGPPSPKKKLAHRRRYTNYPDESFTKSAMALATAQSSNMRRNSNSTMSTIQLPLLNSTAHLVSHMRRHSNNADPRFFASVELGAYMMDNSEAPPGDGDNKNKGISPGVRRIKSAALEIGCPPPSVSNLSPHPNSAETIGGQVLKNPKNAVIPPPSKSLTRGPHLNLYPKNETGDGCSYPYLNYGSEIVYPIAEISDEMQTSQKETDLDSSGDSYSDYDDENSNMKHQFRGFDWDADQSPTARSSDSDYENNGSRSPLLERGCDVRVVRAKNQMDCKKTNCCERHSNKVPQEFTKSVRLKKHKGEPVAEIKFVNENRNRSASTRSSNVGAKKDNCEKIVNGRFIVIKSSDSLSANYFDKTSASSKDLLIEKSSLESNDNSLESKKLSGTQDNEKKQWDREISNTSSSSENNVNKPEADPHESNRPETEETQLSCETKSADESSMYSIAWLFDETRQIEENVSQYTRALGETSTNVPRNLGAIPKQIKNLTRPRASSQKENKKRDSKKERDENQNEEMISMDAVEAQAALVQGLECLFAATNANTVVMPSANREERSRNHRQHSIRSERENSHKTRKRSIEEVAHASTNTLLPTSMPLLAAFLNSRVDFPICLPDASPGPSEPRSSIDEGQRFRPLMDRNHRNRVRKIKRSTRQRNNQSSQHSNDRKTDKSIVVENPNANGVHFAMSYEDTTDGAIHCFMDEYGNWMSYTFDKNSSGRAQVQPLAAPKEDAVKSNQVKPAESTDNPLEAAQHGSCGSLESLAGVDNCTKPKRADSADQSSSNQGSNNPLLSSTNNLSSAVPINTNNANKRFYVFDGGTNNHNDQPRSPVAYVTDSLLEQIEAERQSRMGLPSMHINILMNQQRASQQAQAQLQESTSTPSNVIANTHMPSIGEESYEINITNISKYSKLLSALEKHNQPKPKSYYKFKLLKYWEIKVSMDRLKLMALFDRNLTFRETFISIMLAIMVSVLGSMVLNLGFYKDIYAFWFCFIMAGSQYSLLKSVQPDSASPVHGFNKMIVFSRPVYFCLCAGILCIAHNQLQQLTPVPEVEGFGRAKRSVEQITPLTIYGFEVNERKFLYVIQEVVSKFLLFFPLSFSLGLFPQVNTFLMYLLEQIDMHVFGGNATSSLSAAVYCIARSLGAIGVLYGFAYSGLVEGKKSQYTKHNILFSIFCGLLVPIAYHLSRSASDYTLIWNLIKSHLLPPELYVINDPQVPAEVKKVEPTPPLTEEAKKNSESNISKQNSIGSSASKINFSSETNISKTQKRSQTSSVSSLKIDPRGGDTVNSNSSLKDNPTEADDKSNTNIKQDNMDKTDENMQDPLPKKLQATVNARLRNDVIVCTFLALFVFGIHCTTVFTNLRPHFNIVSILF